ncbi:tripartite tricarboxylate transporter substrate binding protein [Methylocella sp. CPCC 101449]|uniref:Bug family tripartite tricarboxylate transporter substrate binding protein n=1 Tax=Methylocella sp. CPCC 101449 TaxID=2987531 RepID=UPI0028920BC0|nr:tripartite tricarboxylate transporter substrate binding protein [Methylocella sp. CPCC 101449]MDT2022654.1 tripartite tricarboxylate transporter substrate binding protein [Methylocella sp. CPCC 101449]
MRVRCLQIWIAAVALTLVPRLALAAYPDHPIKVICTYVAGAGGDLMVRYYARALSELAGQPVIVENRVGANGHVGNQAAMDAKPDGYTLLITGASAYVGNPLFMKSADYDPNTALKAVATLNELGLALAVNPKLDVHSVADLTKFIKDKNGRARYGAQTSSAMVAASLYLQKIGATATQVNYKSAGDAAADTTAGLIDFFFPDITLAMAQASQGRLRLLASTPANPVSAAPNLQTMQQAGVPDFSYSVIWAAWFPKDTPDPIVNQMHGRLNEIVKRPETKKFLFDVGADQRISQSPEDMAQIVKAEFENWKKIVEAAKIEKQ